MSISGDTIYIISLLEYNFQMNLIHIYRIFIIFDTIILEKKTSAILNTFLQLMIA